MNVSKALREIWSSFRRMLWFTILLVLLGSSVPMAIDPSDRIARQADPFEFDFLGWTLGAVKEKVSQSGLGAAAFIEDGERPGIVRDYLDLVGRSQSLQYDLELAYGDPDAQRGEAERIRLRDELAGLAIQLQGQRPLAEAILQEQISTMLSKMNLGSFGMVFPPVSFSITQLPSSLIVSPRDVIRQDASISLRVDLNFGDKVELEERVQQAEDMSALVVPVGGLGTYPTMILESTSLNWIAEVITHEWVHNYLSLRPLGWNYAASPELRTMNETAASLIGLAAAHQVLSHYYPDLLPPPPSVPTQGDEASMAEAAPPPFDFRAEMRITRLRVDELLGEGEIEQAEAYMESRRLVFWDEGYRIRKLNQAYFAFHGAYADEPGGAAGDDPVGEAVRTLWERMPSPAEFLRAMAGMRTYEDLLRRLDLPG